LNKYYGEGTAEKMSEISRDPLYKMYKFDRMERKRMYEIFTEGKEEAKLLKETYSGETLQNKLHELRLSIIDKTTYFV